MYIVLVFNDIHSDWAQLLVVFQGMGLAWAWARLCYEKKILVLNKTVLIKFKTSLCSASSELDI